MGVGGFYYTPLTPVSHLFSRGFGHSERGNGTESDIFFQNFSDIQK